MSEFQWTDELVKEILEDLYYKLKNRELLTLIASGFIESFKASKQPKQEWEILEGEVFGKPHLWVESCAREPKCRIHSVKRLSDGEVFTVGDEVKYDEWKYIIERFEVAEDGPKSMMAAKGQGRANLLFLKKTCSEPRPVYLTPSEIEKLKNLLK